MVMGRVQFYNDVQHSEEATARGVGQGNELDVNRDNSLYWQTLKIATFQVWVVGSIAARLV